MAHSLSGRLLLLTLFYVLLTEVLILVPSLGRYHRSLLESRAESAEIAILPFTEPGGNQLSDSLRRQLLARAGAEAVILKRPDQRDLYLREMPSRIDLTIDTRNSDLLGEMYQALDCMLKGGNRTVHVISNTRIAGAETVEVIIGESPVRDALLAYAGRILLFGFAISIATALLVFFSLYFVFVRPMSRLTQAMIRFREDPEDAARIVGPSQRQDEIGVAERELAAMQRDLYGFLHQRERLAALGGAVAKIQHDLRNILSSAQLASDRLATIDDPVVQRLAPRLVASLDHAVALATNTLRYGRADEHPPARKRTWLAPIVIEAGDAVVTASANPIAFENPVAESFEIDADPEQLYRILLNLFRNASEALARTPRARIRVMAVREEKSVTIDVDDNGPGIPEAVREKLFRPFASSARPGGSGLGLAIARDLARAHGGDVALLSTGSRGTTFRIVIPDREGT